MSQAYALPRIRLRIRRRRPPSSRIILTLVYIVVCLNQIAFITLRALQGDWVFSLIAIPFWVLLYLVLRRWLRYLRQLEEFGFQLRGIQPIEVVPIALLAFVCIEEWFIV